MAKLIAITGTPCSGKSWLAKKLCEKLGFKRIKMHDFEAECGEYNSEFDCYDLDMELVEKKVAEIVNFGGVDEVFVLDSHVSHLLSSDLVDLCVVVYCRDLKLLKKRLLARGYSEAKVVENLECEIMEVCLDGALENGFEVFMVDGALEYSEELLLEIKGKVE